MRRPKSTLGNLAVGLLVTGLSFAVAEGLIRATYAIRSSMVTEVPLVFAPRDDYGAAPPWLDAFRLLERDPILLWKNRPGVHRRYVDVFGPARTSEERESFGRRFLPWTPASLRGNPTWDLSLNSEGFRESELPKAKPASVFRIVCLGDSWTLGANVDQPRAYPQRLGALIREGFPGATVEVLNLGVMGYSSYQGRELLARRAIALDPDVVVLGFAMNDGRVAGWRDEDLRASATVTAARRVERGAERLELYKLLRYWALTWTRPRPSIGDHLRAEAAGLVDGGEASDRAYAKVEAWTRVPLTDYARNVEEMIRLARSRGAGVILMFNELWRDRNPYRNMLEALASRHHIPLVDSSALIAEARRRAENELERTLGLTPTAGGLGAGGREVTVVFRVHAGRWPVGKAISIVGAHAQLGGLVPNRIAMYDDATHGDQRAGDTVWSYAATFPTGTDVFYVYTNSGREGRWEGLDVPHIRSFRVEAPAGQAVVYRPIESFGSLAMQADGWHTNAAGYDLIARAVLERLEADGRFQAYLARIGAARS